MPGQGAAVKIMIVEDEAIIAFDLADAVAKLGFTVIGPVPTSDKALDAIDDSRPDAVIMDILLRGEWAIPLAIRLSSEDIPFLVVTGLPRKALEKIPAFEGVENIGKPIDINQLAEALENLHLYRNSGALPTD